MTVKTAGSTLATGDVGVPPTPIDSWRVRRVRVGVLTVLGARSG